MCVWCVGGGALNPCPLATSYGIAYIFILLNASTSVPSAGWLLRGILVEEDKTVKSIYNQSPAERQTLPHNQKRRWKYTEEDTSGGECYDCGLWYGGDAWADIVVKDEIWEFINPSEYKGGGLLCFNCMNRRLTFLGLEDVPMVIGSGPFVCAEGEDDEIE